jgi:hypothetical protein
LLRSRACVVKKSGCCVDQRPSIPTPIQTPDYFRMKCDRDLDTDYAWPWFGCGHGQITDVAIARNQHGCGQFVDADELCSWSVCGLFVVEDWPQTGPERGMAMAVSAVAD